MQAQWPSRQTAAMQLRHTLLALLIAPTLANAGGFDAAMACIHSTMTSAFVPATANVEQVANVALARCADEIERAAIEQAGAPLVLARIDASRAAVRSEMHGYALSVAAGPAPAGADDAAVSQPSASW
jgi:hypothetical protein